MAATYEPLATASGTNITFSSIPATYTDLRVVYVTASGSQNVDVRLNGDSSSNYNWVLIEGYGSTLATRASSGTFFPPEYNHYSGIGFVTLDIQNYSNTSAQKQILSTFQNNVGASGAICYAVCRYSSGTSAISSISLLNNSITTATLYGIKVA